MSDLYYEINPIIPEELIIYGYYYDPVTNISYSEISGLPGYYITSNGDVISYKKENPIYLKTYKNQHGHQYVDLKSNGKRYKCLVHRLVAEAFLENPNNYPIVRHLDDDPDNNWVGNLALGTQLDNRMDCIRNGNDYKTPVYCYETNKIYDYAVNAAIDLGVSKASITHCCKGISDSVKGYHVCYSSDMDDKLNDEDWTAPKINKMYKPLIAVSPDGSEYYFDSRKDAAKFIGIPECGISSTINGTTPHTHGWKFREA